MFIFNFEAEILYVLWHFGDIITTNATETGASVIFVCVVLSLHIIQAEVFILFK